MTANQPADRDVEAVAAVLGASDIADYIRDARSARVPCDHWVGQPVAVCAPCLRDRIVPHLAAALLPLIREREAAAWERALSEAADGLGRLARDVTTTSLMPTDWSEGKLDGIAHAADHVRKRAAENPYTGSEGK